MKLRNKSSDKKKKESLPKVEKKIKKLVQKKSTYKKQKEQANPLKRTKTIASSIKESKDFLKREKEKQKDQSKSGLLKRTRTIAASIKESDDYLQRQEKIEKESIKKNLKSPKKGKSPIPEKKIKQSPKPSKSSKKSVSKSKSVDKKEQTKQGSKIVKKEEKKNSVSKKEEKAEEKKKSISKKEEKKEKKKKSVSKKEEKKEEKKQSASKKEEKKEEKKLQKDKKGKEKKEAPKPITFHPPVIVRQPSKLADDNKPASALKRQESKLGQPGFPTAGIIDAVFCMDTTGSMGSYLARAKKVIEGIIKRIDDKVKGTKIDVKFGFVAYRDHPPQDRTYVTKFNNLDTEENIKKFIETLDTIPGGGGDFPEAVMDGLMDAAKLTKWRDSTEFPQLRYIFHICDAPPHGQAEFGSASSSWSSGCPCGITTNDITHQINLHQIHYRLIKIGSSLEQMSKVFKEKFTNFDEQAIDSADNLEIHVSDMIMRELLPDFD